MKKLKVSLLDGMLTLTQQLILAAWGLVLVSIVGLWAFSSLSLLSAGTSEALLSIGRLLGLLATFFALTQFMLMGRIAWIESSFGLDRLASYHRLNGYIAIIFIVLHPMFIVGSSALASGQSIGVQYAEILQNRPYVWLALVAEILFTLVVISSIYIARKRLKFEMWYFVHLMVYLAIVIVPFHQFVNGGSLAGSSAATTYWLGLYLFVALNLLIWRFGLLIYNYFKFDFRVSRVVKETPTTTSVYIKARGLKRLKYKPGQFVLVRILTKKRWWQEHPFTVSWIPHDDELRLTIRNVGDYTADIANLKVGARVVMAGPFGRFTSDVAVTKKRLFIAGGVGITPIRTLFEEAISADTDSVVIYGNKTSGDVPLKAEVDQLATSKTPVHYVYSDEKIKHAEYGLVDGPLIKRLVPDVEERDIYLCGPPPMMAVLVTQLTEIGVEPEQIHYERFALV